MGQENGLAISNGLTVDLLDWTYKPLTLASSGSTYLVMVAYLWTIKEVYLFMATDALESCWDSCSFVLRCILMTKAIVDHCIEGSCGCIHVWMGPCGSSSKICVT